MAEWITDRTQADVDRVKELAEKAKAGTWTESEQSEWSSGLKGALSYTDYNRIENGIRELAEIVGAEYSSKPTYRTVRIATAKDSDGNIPAWTSGTSTLYFFAPITFKKDKLILKSFEFQINGFLSGAATVYFRKYSKREDSTSVPTDALVKKSITLNRGSNLISVSMDNISLEKDVEYQFYIYGSNKFYSPSIQPAQIEANNYLDIATGSEYCDEDKTRLFSGTVVLLESAMSSWDINSYLTTADVSRWLKNATAIKEKCSGYGTTPSIPNTLSYDFESINQFEKVLSDMEQLAKNYSYYCSELICGGEPYYAVY